MPIAVSRYKSSIQQMIGGMVLVWLLILAPSVIAQEAETFTVEGMLIQGTENGDALPDSLPLNLEIFSPDGERIQGFGANSSDDYTFRFENIPQLVDHFLYRHHRLGWHTTKHNSP